MTRTVYSKRGYGSKVTEDTDLNMTGYFERIKPIKELSREIGQERSTLSGESSSLERTRCTSFAGDTIVFRF